MARTLVVTLTDDLDGGDADETVTFGLDGKSYEIDLSEANAEKLRKALAPFVEKGTATTKPSRNKSRPEKSGVITAFSKLTDDEKKRYRKWAKAPTARRIPDARVDEWKSAGKP